MRNTPAFLLCASLLVPAAISAQRIPDTNRRYEAEMAAMRRQLEMARIQMDRAAAELSQRHLEEVAAKLHKIKPSVDAALYGKVHLEAALQNVMPAQKAVMKMAETELEAAAAQLQHLSYALPPGLKTSTPYSLPESFAPQDPADSLWRHGRTLINRQDWRNAAVTFRQIRTDQRFAGSAYRGGSYYYEALALSRRGSTDELRHAQNLLNEMKQQYPSDRTIRQAEVLNTTIMSRLARSGDERAARELEERATVRGSSQCPAEEDDVRVVALNALLQMDNANAVEILREVMSRRDECSAPLRRRAIFMLSQRQTQGIDQILLDAIRNDPDSEVREGAVFWLSRVNTPEAVATLEQVLTSSSDRAFQEKALFALSQNRSERATEVLRAYATRDDVPADLRRNAIHWLGQRRGGASSEFLRDLYPRVQDEELRTHIVFAVSQSRDSANVDWLLDIAMNENEGIEARKRALFYAAQQRTVPVERIGALYGRTTDREMKEQILFALSQRLREPAAVDRLMDIGRNEADVELRNRAVFWLSQSRDPRVAPFLLEIIKR